MGSQIVKVPPGFEHPKDDAGEFIPGAHYELLYSMPQDQLACFQIYENISEGTPTSQIFESLDALGEWMVAAGYSPAAVQIFIEVGFAPMLVVRRDGAVVNGIEGMRERVD